VSNKVGVNPAYLIPVEKEKIPKTEIGKIQRSQLSQRWETGEFDNYLRQIDVPRQRLSQEVPKTEIEKIIAAIWREVLHINEVDIHDNFFDLGGNSLLIAAVTSKLQAVLQQDIPLTTVFQYPTIRSLARYLSQGSNHLVDREIMQSKIRGEKRRKKLMQANLY